MAKKKSSSNKKKNRKGAAGKKASTAAGGDHGYEVSAYLQYLHNKQPNLTEREKRLLPMYEYAESSDMSDVVLFKEEKSLMEAREDLLSWNEADSLYFKDPRMWLFTMNDMIFICDDEHDDEHIFEKVFKGSALNEWLEQTQKRTEAMVKSAITSEKIQGVLIDGLVLKLTVAQMIEMQLRRIVSSDDQIFITAKSMCQLFCQLLERFTNVAKDRKKISRVAGYALCQPMILSFFRLNDTISSGAAIFTVLVSGILEQVLRSIALPWLLEPFAIEEEDMIRDFFRRLCCPYASFHKTFKRGSPLHNVLLDILQGRVRPCKENTFVMASLYSLKRFVDMRSFRPIKTCIQNPVIDKFRRTCLQCKKVDHSKQMLVCAKCKFVSYCSKKCQVGDWKDHKEDCGTCGHVHWKIDRKFTRKFLNKHQKLLIEKLKSTSVETGLGTMELVIDLDFCGSGYAIAPALRDPPEFAIEQATYFLLQNEKKTLVDSITSKLGKKFVFLCLSFEDTDFGCVCAVQLQSDTFGEIWFVK